MRRLSWILVSTFVIAALLLALAPVAARADSAFPALISLPAGFQPEGVASGRGTSFYAGSLGSGAIYRGDLRTGQGALLAPATPGRGITGLYVDNRSNYLFASGAFTGQAFVFDAATGDLLATYHLATAFPSFINDVFVTRDAAYFTDSFQPFLYRVPLGPGGALPDPSAVQRIPLSGDFVQLPGPNVFNSNGIEASSDGKWLLIVNTASGDLYRVDPQTGRATRVDLGGGSLTFGDGLRLQGHTLYAVRNQLNLIAVVNLAPDFASGAIVDTITNPNFDVPTTLALFGSSLYAVDARFNTPPTPQTPYGIVRVARVP